MTTFIKHGSSVTIHSDADVKVSQHLPAGNYIVAVDPAGTFFLKDTTPFEYPKKVYGDVVKRATRILNTFEDRPRSTGVLLQGMPGSGKTLLARQVCMMAAENGIPTVIINEDFTGDKFSNFIASIDQPCIIMFDEFEKVYGREEQNGVLTLFDGVFTQKKLFIVTVNDAYALIDPFRSRPGRLYYQFKYAGLDYAFIEEYVKENLVNVDNAESALVKFKGPYKGISFDGLASLISEMNRYDEAFDDVIDIMNVEPPTTASVDVTVVSKGGHEISFIRHNIDDFYTETDFGIQFRSGKETEWQYFDTSALSQVDHANGVFTFDIPNPITSGDRLFVSMRSTDKKKVNVLGDVF